MANIYVNIDTGNDTTGTGAVGAPYQTLNKGITVASANDTVILAPSTTDYAWLTDTIPAGLTIKCLTVPNMITGEWARVSGGGVARVYTLLGNFTSENIVWYNNYPAGDKSCFFWSVNLTGLAQVLQFTRCVFDDIKTLCSTVGRGGMVGNSNSVSTPTQTSITTNFDRCLFNNIKRSAASGTGAIGNTTGTINYWNFNECTVYNAAAGEPLNTIIANNNSSTTVFRNTAILNEHATTPKFASNSGATTAQACNVNYCCYSGMDTTAAIIANSVAADPLFLDAGAKDFRLKPASPCIDAGVIV
jgi:hypothetical protein